jgi:hypothetical protein
MWRNEPICTIVGNIKWCTCYGKIIVISQKIKNLEFEVGLGYTA